MPCGLLGEATARRDLPARAAERWNAPADLRPQEPALPLVETIAPVLPRNRLLAALPAEIFEKLRRQLELVVLPLRQVFQHADRPITSV